MLTNVLIPGRHHLVTEFMWQYLWELLHGQEPMRALDGEPVLLGPEPNLVWAVTSANHSGTRRNPLPGYIRAMALEHLRLTSNSFTYLIADIGTTPRFADHVVKDISVQSFRHLELTPENTVVAVSTPAVIRMYQDLGFRILPLELEDLASGCFRAETAWELLLGLVAAGDDWRRSEAFAKIHSSSRHVLGKYDLVKDIQDIHSDLILGDEGDLTDTRNYETYNEAFTEGARRKLGLVEGDIVPGRIVDIGCANGAIIERMCELPALAESDFFGVEAARRLYELCEWRRAQGIFGNPNVFFYHRNIMREPLFPDGTVNTTTTFSLTHEIESYIGRDGLLRFIEQVSRHTAPGGVWINSDVVGPEDGDKLVLLWCNPDDGENIGPVPTDQATPEFLRRMSTASRFRQFAQDFRAKQGDGFGYETVEKDGQSYFRLRLADAADFASKKDYLDSWASEMNERFCYWSFSQWREAVEAAGFEVAPSSRAFRNEWIALNRYKGAFELFEDGSMEPLDFPVTSMVLVARKTR